MAHLKHAALVHIIASGGNRAVVPAHVQWVLVETVVVVIRWGLFTEMNDNLKIIFISFLFYCFKVVSGKHMRLHIYDAQLNLTGQLVAVLSTFLSVSLLVT